MKDDPLYYAKVLLNDKYLNEKSLSKIKDPTLAEEWAKAIVHFVFRNGPVEDIHSDGLLTETDMKILNKYMTNQLTGLILTMQKGEWYLLDKMADYYKMFGRQWDKADLTKFNEEKNVIIEKIAAIVKKESINYDFNIMEENCCVDVEYLSTLDEGTGVIKYFARINNICHEVHEKVGNISFSLYNFSLYESWMDVIEVADCYSNEEILLITALQDSVDEEWPEGRGILLQSLIIQEQFQQKGIGTETMEQLISYSTISGADFVILLAKPPIKDSTEINREKDMKRLVRFYESLGFEELVTDNSQGSTMIMYL